MQIIKLIYFWRLSEEKWFRTILDYIASIKWNLQSNLIFYIFWDWPLKKELLDLWIKLINFNWNIKSYENSWIYYFWREKFDTIKEFLKFSHFSIMLSSFLETFWLSALESLSCGVPVIWIKKWWLIPFVFDKFNVNNYKWSNVQKFSDMISCIFDMTNQEYKKYAIESFEIAQKYSKQNWIDSVRQIFDWKKILMVSDYLVTIWWIESYILNSWNLLQDYWYKIDYFWFWWINWNIPKRIRLFWLFATCFNVVYWIKYIVKLIKFKPDIIRFHSVGRFLWWIIIFISKFVSAKKIIMYHDFGYFHPYPSMIFEEGQLNYPFSINNFVQASQKSFPKNILVYFKAFSMLLIKRLLINTIDIHLVPSIYMIAIISHNYNIEENKINLLSHYI